MEYQKEIDELKLELLKRGPEYLENYKTCLKQQKMQHEREIKELTEKLTEKFKNSKKK